LTTIYEPQPVFLDFSDMLSRVFLHRGLVLIAGDFTSVRACVRACECLFRIVVNVLANRACVHEFEAYFLC